MRFKIFKEIAKAYISFFTNRAISKPKRAGWYITDQCNAKCIKCDIWRTEFKNTRDLDLEKNKKIIDNLKDFGINQLEIVGGEPFSYKYIFEIIKYAKKQDIKIELNTNGLALNEKQIDKLLNLGINRIGFSVDGATAEIHDKMIGIDGAYKRIIKNIQYYTSKGGVGHFSAVISPINIEEVEGLYFLAQKLNLDGIIYQPFQYVPSFLSSEKKGGLEYQKNLQKIDEVLDKLIKFKKTKKFIMYNSIPYLKKIKQLIRNKKMPNFCFGPYCHITIDNQGNLVPCTPYRKKIGNLITHSLKELWNSEEFIRTRKELKKSAICHSCWLTGDAEETIALGLMELIKKTGYKYLFKSK